MYNKICIGLNCITVENRKKFFFSDFQLELTNVLFKNNIILSDELNTMKKKIYIYKHHAFIVNKRNRMQDIEKEHIKNFLQIFS